jgi:putative methionine-R-sulfoxide reductase with GAF domain
VTSIELGNGRFLLESIIDISESVKNQEKLEKLQKSTIHLSNQNNLSDAFDALLTEIKSIFGYMFLGIGKKVGSKISYINTIGWDVPNDVLEIPLDSSVSGKCLKTGNVIYVPDTLLEPDYFSEEESQLARSELVLPLNIDGKIEYVLNLEHSEPNGFSDADIELIKTLSRYASEVLTGIKHKEDLRENAINLQNSFETLSKVTAESNKNRLMFQCD